MKYDFDTPVDRRGTNSLKWDVGPDELPMWVADMDFKTAPEITNAIIRRAEHGVFGYNIIPDSWYDAYISWWQRRHGLRIEREQLIFCTGVVPAISSIVRKLTTPAENVVMLTPVYNIFFNSTFNNGRNILECPLLYEDGEYAIDFNELDRSLALPQTTMLIFCNPHNPVGRIWDRETLKRVGELCVKHHVIAVSDEIHCDITAPGREYVPFASASRECYECSVTCLAPTKAFNLAGIQTAAVMIPNEFLRNKVNRALNTDECAEPNSFAIQAAEAAFTYGEPWLSELREYIENNRRAAAEFVRKRLPTVKLVKSEATYLLWLDCKSVCDSSKALAGHIRAATGLYVSEGAQYGAAGEGFLRLNIACSASVLSDGLKKLEQGINSYLR